MDGEGLTCSVFVEKCCVGSLFPELCGGDGMGRVVKNDPVVSISRLSTRKVGDNEKIGSEFA